MWVELNLTSHALFNYILRKARFRLCMYHTLYSVSGKEMSFLAAGKAAAALGKTFQAEAEGEAEADVRPISNFFSVFPYCLCYCLY